MGLLHTSIAIASPLRRHVRRELADVLVDTGADLTMIPRRVLEDLRIAVEKQIRFETATGAEMVRDVGHAIVHANGQETNDEVIFGEENDLVLLGARSLQGLNMKVDLVRRRLVAGGPMLMAANAASRPRAVGVF
jgi:aspartyl protease family protein